MKSILTCAAVAACALWLAACGGGSDTPETVGPQGAPTTPGNFTAVVSFGDSLSDAGSYAPATSFANNGTAPYLGGRFTTNLNDPITNASTARVWVETLAASLSVPLTPAQVGFSTTSVNCPAAAVPALANSCTAYGQGGARVTNPAGIGKAEGALTVPVQTQIANHLARFGSFKSTDLVLVFAGANDVLVQFQVFAAQAAPIQAAVTAGTLSKAQADQQIQPLLAAAQTEVNKAAQELAGYVRNEVLAKGGRYVAVTTLPDLSLTPLGASPPFNDASRAALTNLVDNFNLTLRSGLNAQPIQLIDANAFFRTVYANPSAYNIANVSGKACDKDKITAVTAGRVTNGSSLFCNATPGAPFNTLATGADPATWFFADDIHPTTAVHALFAAEVRRLLSSFGWI